MLRIERSARLIKPAVHELDLREAMKEESKCFPTDCPDLVEDAREFCVRWIHPVHAVANFSA